MSVKKTKPTFASDLPAGILDRRSLPDDGFDNIWNSIFLEDGVKEQLLNQAVVGFSLRAHGVGREEGGCYAMG